MNRRYRFVRDWAEPVILDANVRMSSSERVSLASANDDATHVVDSDTQTREIRYTRRL